MTAQISSTIAADRSVPQAVCMREMDRWMLIDRPENESVIVLVVDDEDDDEITAAAAAENRVPSHRFGGVWGTSAKDGNWVVGFRLTELGAGDSGLERIYWTDNLHRELLEAIVEVPHLVALLPRELAGDPRALEDLIPRLGGAIHVLVDDRSPQVERVLAEAPED